MYNKRDLILFELWKTCKNHCTFCVDKFMKESSESVKRNFQVFKERARNIENASAVGFLGGELFDGSIEELDIKQDFIEFLDILIQKIKDGNIGTLCITTNLIYPDSSEVKYYLDYLIKGGILENKILITTSYDNRGRFNRPHSEEWWKANVEELKRLYPQIQYHCEFILTDNLCTAVLDKTFNLIDFLKWWNGSINFNQPYTGFKFMSKEEFEKTSPGFFLKRKNFIDFCNYLKYNNTIDISKLFIGTNAGDETLMTEEDYGKVVIRYREFENDAMGRKEEHFGYIDSNKDIFEDIKRIANADR